MKSWFLLSIALVCCSAHTTTEPCGNSAKEFLDGTVECVYDSDTCAFDVDNKHTELSGYPTPVSYTCICNTAFRYACFGSPGLPGAKPIEIK